MNRRGFLRNAVVLAASALGRATSFALPELEEPARGMYRYAFTFYERQGEWTRQSLAGMWVDDEGDPS